MSRIRCMLADWLKLKNLTQADVVRDTGLSPNAVNRMYHSSFDRIDCKTALTLCDYLGCNFDLLFVLEQNGQLRGVAFEQGRQLQPEIEAEKMERRMQKVITEKYKEIEAYEAKCRVQMEAEIESHITKYHRQHEALLQKNSDVCAALRDYMQGVVDHCIDNLKDDQTNGKVANSLVDS